jgi:hypothetical protein
MSEKQKKDNISKEDLASVPYYLMIMTNLTIEEYGQKQFFMSDKKEYEKVQGMFLIKIFEKFCENIYKEEMDFCSSIIANISALKEGRVFILENKLFDILLHQFDKMNNFKIHNMLRVFRNCCFEYEKYEEDLVQKDGHMILLAFKVLILLNLKSERQKINNSHVDSIHFTHWDMSRSIDEKDQINELIIDIFVTLTNTTQAYPTMTKNKLHNIWEMIQVNIKGSEIADRVWAVSNFLSIH